jgi:hypothetical protein
MQIIATVFIGLGMMAILANKFEFNKSFIPSTLHSVFGAITLLLIMAQIYVGMEKMSTEKKVRRWHGNAGLLTWDAAILTILLGMAQFLQASWFNLFTATLLCLAWSAVHFQFSTDTAPSTGLTDSEAGYDVGGGGLLIPEL